MGIFSRKRNWAAGPIDRPRHNRVPCPDVAGIALEVAGPDNEAAAAKLLENWHMALVAHAHANLRNVELADHYADLDAVVQRPDCSTEMIYNFLCNLGGGGRAIAEDWRSMLFDTFIPAARQEMSAADSPDSGLR